MTGERPRIRRVWIPQGTVFASSACIMMIELVAGRIISRQLGASLYTWTSVIGVVLAGIALGNWIGGLLADRRPASPTLSVLFVAASAACVATIVLNQWATDWVFLWTLPWSARVASHVAIVFLPPSLALGTISPVAATVALERGHGTGRTIGSVYAWGVLGSIVGTFAAGFYLIAAFGSVAVVWSVAGALAAMALLYGVASWRSWAWACALALLAIPGLGQWPWARSLGESWAMREQRAPNVLYVDESQYSHIEVRRAQEGDNRRDMFLDKLVHSTIDMNRPADLQYPYERIYAAVTSHLAGDRDSLNTLTIGGGGYVYPRYLQERYPKSRVEVVEIDPAVTRAAIVAFGMPEDHGLTLHHEDGRVFLRRTTEARRRGEKVRPYDFIYEDAINDYSVPYQITTKECLLLAEELLAPGGAFLMNIVDIMGSGLFLGSMIETMETVFPEVTVFVEGRWHAGSEWTRTTFILAGTRRPLDVRAIEAGYDRRFEVRALTAQERRKLRERCSGRILTDDWAPVENLLAPVVRDASDDIAAAHLVSRASEELQAGRPDAARREAERALRLDPDRGSAHAVMANAFFLQGDLPQAIHHYEASIRADPLDVAARNNYGAALLRLGRLDDAVRELEAALQLDPSHARAQQNLAKARAARSRSAVPESPNDR